MKSFKDLAKAAVFRFIDSDQYGVKTGDHSYVVAEDGELIKRTVSEEQTQLDVISAWQEACNEII